MENERRKTTRGVSQIDYRQHARQSVKPCASKYLTQVETKQKNDLLHFTLTVSLRIRTTKLTTNTPVER